MSEACILVECLVSLNNLLQWFVGLDDLGGEYATGKVTTIGDEVDVGIKMSLHLTQALLNLGHMLMLECLVDAHIAHTP